ncbi:enoyl-CoA hydratase-related protein [Roseibacterium sp. SDUM158016]|uniref:enoyl-CoA hydratase/isomerase family protein n=1 Tax=Roseicyclus sediminis TaxID=2980997 RepID=UPI0021D11130|nr:enoyl-CoA hydratase-related protein [Roseibacterium sp. SDUM158016]MCU4652103.1 enoyl-CoA hydratase-related protein [Roseibacterium sp. SDUM158016]
MSDPGSSRAVARLHRDGPVAIVTLDRPERRNAVDAATSRVVDRLVREAEADESIGAIVLTGTGDRAFCSGMDMKEAAAIGAGHGLLPDGGFCGLTERTISKPLIAAVNGAAVAGGFELCLACDLVVAAEHATFRLPEVTHGMVAFTGGVQRLAQALPRPVAMEIILGGRTFGAERMAALGLVNRVVPADRLMAETLALAEGILSNPWSAVREARALYEVARDRTLSDAIAEGHARADRLMRSPASRSGIAAYADGRNRYNEQD